MTPSPTAGAKCLGKNGKTIRSIDLSTDCPKRQAGNPCKYCYVEASRSSGYRAKLVYTRAEYKGEILRMTRKMINRLNACGGLRLFSFGDYISWMDPDIERICNDAEKKGLLLKAITKQTEFVHKWHDRMNVIHVSVDNVGCGVPWDEAQNLRKMYPNVRIRAAVMRWEDLDALRFVDIITLNHAMNGYHLFSAAEKKAISETYPMKVCCLSGSCETCEIKCM